ncbi:PAS domain-containing sensor histidine kinase [Litoreibacter roseus]|nr:PAS domain-containing protein [Litoreibacter roseus]
MLSSSERFATLETFAEQIGQPVFIVDVEGEKQFRFRYLNSAHESATGIIPDDFIGKMPHDVVPERVADTLVVKYETCRARKKPYSYEEELELAGKSRVWQTTLSPVLDAFDDVKTLIGVAIDITRTKQGEFAAQDQLTQMMRTNEELQLLASSTAQDVRGSLQSILGMITFLQDGFLDLGDQKFDQLNLCHAMVTNTIGRMDRISNTAASLQLDTNAKADVDFSHVGLDIAANADPDKRFTVHVADSHIHTDRVAVQMVLRTLFENATKYAKSKITMRVSDEGAEPGRLNFYVSDDGSGLADDLRCDGTPIVPTAAGGMYDLGMSTAAQLITARGGDMVRCSPDFEGGATIGFSLPGQMVSKDAKAVTG